MLGEDQCSRPSQGMLLSGLQRCYLSPDTPYTPAGSISYNVNPTKRQSLFTDHIFAALSKMKGVDLTSMYMRGYCHSGRIFVYPCFEFFSIFCCLICGFLLFFPIQITHADRCGCSQRCSQKQTTGFAAGSARCQLSQLDLDLCHHNGSKERLPCVALEQTAEGDVPHSEESTAQGCRTEGGFYRYVLFMSKIMWTYVLL